MPEHTDNPAWGSDRGTCPSCGARVRLNSIGRVAPHASSILSWLDCGGAGYRPKEARARG